MCTISVTGNHWACHGCSCSWSWWCTYRHIPHSLPDLTGHCNFKRRSTSLTQLLFLILSHNSVSIIIIIHMMFKIVIKFSCYSWERERARRHSYHSDIQSPLYKAATLSFLVIVEGERERELEAIASYHFWFQIFKVHSTKQWLLHDFGAEMITVATANNYSLLS